MRLTSLHLTQFRSYASCSIAFAPERRRHVFLGPNGAGKTNLLEAMSALSTTSSMLGIQDEDLLQWNETFYRVRGDCVTDGGDGFSLEVAFQTEPRRQKACFRNDVKVPASALVGQLPCVLFLPQDLQLFTGAPSDRRRFLDDILSQIHPGYFEMLAEYGKVLKQRNALLRRIAEHQASEQDLAPWDAAVAEQGAALTIARLELVEAFGMTLANETRVLGEQWRDVRLSYQRSGAARSQPVLRDEIQVLLERARGKELALQTTTVGPHRDDWMIVADGRPLQNFASRGQQRIAVLALLFLQASYLELRRGEKPLILLDDIFSELDDAHQEAVLASFADNQVVLTGTRMPEEIGDACVWHVSPGHVIAADPS